MDEACGVNRRQRTAQIDPDERRFAGAERTVLVETLLERGAANQLHPETDAVIVHIHAVHCDHVGVPYSRQQPALRGNPRCLQILHGIVDSQELQRHFPLEMVVPDAVDVAERSAAEALEQCEVPPAPDRRRVRNPRR
jgi:hypothetical protein